MNALCKEFARDQAIRIMTLYIMYDVEVLASTKRLNYYIDTLNK